MSEPRGRIAEYVLAEIRARLPIEAVVGRVTQLRGTPAEGNG